MKDFNRPASPFDPDYFEKGGPGSGNRGHKGRPGMRGGSAPRGEGGTIPNGPVPTPAPAPAPEPPKPPVVPVPDPTPPPQPVTPKFTPATTLQEAHAYAKSLGVKTYLLSTSKRVKQTLRAANKTNEGLAILHAQGLPMPDTVAVDGAYFTGRHRGAAGMYSGALDTLYVNPRGGSFGKDGAEYVKRAGASGFWSSSNENHVVFHEMGHMAHSKYDRSAYNITRTRMDPADKVRFAGVVSQYALTAKTEFVAEVFAAHMGGKRYSQDVYDYYNAQRGWPLKM